MSQTNVEIRTLSGGSLAVGSSGPRTVTIDRSTEAGGLGLGFNGGELLLLAIGGCYSNDIYREAAKRGIAVNSVRVKVDADWSGDPVRAQNVSFSVIVEADASEATILDLIRHTDEVAEIPNSLRLGTEVRLTDAKAVSHPSGK
jgi:putative redox protein